jgi:hypothetical protein
MLEAGLFEDKPAGDPRRGQAREELSDCLVSLRCEGIKVIRQPVGLAGFELWFENRSFDETR